MSGAAAILGRDEALVGMVHVGALPGTPAHREPLPHLIEHAVRDATALATAGFDALIIENMHDVPYLRREVGPEIVAGMTAVGGAVRDAVGLPIGVQILAGANRAALAVAHTIGATFIRAEGFVFASVADEGLLSEADAGPLLRYRRSLGAEGVAVLADIKKKHSAHALTGDVDIAETAQAAAFFGADGVVVTGTATGRPVDDDDLDRVQAATTVPVLVGSGVTAQTAPHLLQRANGLIVGSSIKVDGFWRQPVDAERARALVESVRSAVP